MSQAQQQAQVSAEKTQTGLDENVASTLSYVLGWLTGIIMLLVETENNTVRFHAAQSIVVFGGLFVALVALSFLQVFAGFGGFFGGLLFLFLSLVSFVVGVGAFVLWVYLLITTFQGNNPRLPIAAPIADDIV